MIKGVYCPRCSLSLNRVNYIAVRILPSSYNPQKKKLDFLYLIMFYHTIFISKTIILAGVNTSRN